MRPRLCLAVHALALLASALPVAQVRARQKPLRELFVGMVDAESFAEDGSPVALRILDREEQPIAGSKVELVVRDVVRGSAVSDASGHAWLIIDRRSFRQDGVVRVDAPGSCSGCSISCNFTTRIGSRQDGAMCARIVDLREALSVRSADGRFAVLHDDPERARVAAAVLEQVVTGMSAFEGVTGRSSPSVAVYLEEEEACIQPAGSGFQETWGLRTAGASLALGELATLVHECAEGLLRDVVDEDGAGDPRWFFDGFADLIAIRSLERCDLEEAAHLREGRRGTLTKAGDAVVDVSDWRSMSRAPRRPLEGVAPSYAKSLAIATCLDDAGPTDIAALLASLGSAPPATRDDFLAILATWGGTTTAELARRLRSLDAASAAECLDAGR